MNINYDHFPKFLDDIENGRPLVASIAAIEAAQERVTIRRRIRKARPDLGASLRGVDTYGLLFIESTISA